MIDDFQFVDGTQFSRVVEALIFSSEEPITSKEICQLLQETEEEAEVDPESVDEIVEMLNDQYEDQGRPFFIENVAGGYLFLTRKRYHHWLRVQQHKEAYRRLSPSALEALSIVAYKQPLTKPEVDDIRGVDSGYIMRQLLEKDLVEVSGRADAPGKPLLYRTTSHFLRHFGINTVDELPRPREIEDILSDDDMSEHRQYLIDRGELPEGINPEETTDSDDQGQGSEQQGGNSMLFQSNGENTNGTSGNSTPSED